MQIDAIEDFIAEAKSCLKAWGAEELRQLRLLKEASGEIYLHGWPSDTVAHVVMRHGGRAPTGTGMRREAEKPAVVQTDAIVSELAQGTKDGHEIRRVLYAHYVFRLSLRQGARMTHKSVRVYRNLLETGQAWVAGAMARAV